MNKQQKEVCKNILYAVETGGQAYGKHDYTAFVPAFTVSDGETAITIGAGQWLGAEAKRLLQLIRSTDKAGFETLDTAGIGKDLDTADWNNYRVQKSSAKAVCIRKIIDSETGRKCQDQLMLQQIDEYEKTITAAYGEMSAGGMVECINIIHHGGSGALKRILAKTATPYTAATIYAALCTDPADKSNDNQVGDYVSRQKAVYSMIIEHLKEGDETGMTENELRQKVVTTAQKYLGSNEADGSHRRIIDIYNTKQKTLPRGYKVTYSDAWCATFVSAISILCGLTDIMPTECGCGAMVDLYRALGRWQENDAYTPKPGDVIMYYWKDGSNYASTDCVGYPDHVGIVVSVSGKTIKVIEGNKNDAVGYRDLNVNGRYIRGYCLPNYALKAGTQETTPAPAEDDTKGKTDSTGTVKNKVLWDGTVTAEGGLAIRTWAGGEYKECSFSPLKYGAVVGVCDQIQASDGAIWYFIKYNGKYGFVYSGFISKKADEKASAPAAVKQVAFAQSFNKSVAGAYKVTAANGLYLRYEPGKIADNNVVDVIPHGAKVHNYGYYTTVNGVKWLLVAYKDKTGFVSGTYVKR